MVHGNLSMDGPALQNEPNYNTTPGNHVLPTNYAKREKTNDGKFDTTMDQDTEHI